MKVAKLNIISIALLTNAKKSSVKTRSRGVFSVAAGTQICYLEIDVYLRKNL